MSSHSPLHRPSEVEQLTLTELEHEADRLNREAEHMGVLVIYLEDRTVIVELGGPDAWFRVLERRLDNFYWVRDVRARLAERLAS
jgi:hypothetical protein